MTHDEIAAAIQSATLEVCSTMLGLEAAPGDMTVAHTAGGHTAEVVALLGLAGDWVGSGTVSCDPHLACKISAQLLMTPFDTVNDDVLDAIAEVGNMVIGNVKTALEARLGPMGLSTPTVIYGRNFETRSAGNREWVIVPFDCEGSRLNVRVSISPRGNRAAFKPHHGFQLQNTVTI